MGMENIGNNDGIGIAVSGMCIVFVVLVLISTFISQLPRCLALFDRVVPEQTEDHSASVATSSSEVASDEMLRIAAIGFAMYRARVDRD